MRAAIDDLSAMGWKPDGRDAQRLGAEHDSPVPAGQAPDLTPNYLVVVILGSLRSRDELLRVA